MLIEHHLLSRTKFWNKTLTLTPTANYTELMLLAWTIRLFGKQWQTLVNILSFAGILSASCHWFSNFGLIQFIATPGMKPLSCPRQFIWGQQRVVKNNFQEKRAISYMFYFGACKTFCCCSCYYLPRTSSLENWRPGTLASLCDPQKNLHV